MLFENAQDVGDLLAVIWTGPAPANNDPLTDIGRSEPDLEPVAQAGHLFRGAAPCAAVGLATTPSPAGGVTGDVAGVIGQRAGLGGAARRSELVEEPGVLGGDLRPLVGHVVFAEDRLDRAYRLAGAAVVGVDVEHPLAFVDGVDRAFVTQVLSLTSMNGSEITDVMSGSTSLGDLPVRLAGLHGRVWSAGWAAC